MAEAGDSHSVAVLDGNLYAVGGYNGDYFSSVERYDPALDAWVALAPMGQGRKSSCCSAGSPAGVDRKKARKSGHIV